MMNWDAIGAIGEVIGALAVVATLFYLAAQIRQNSRMMVANIRELRMGATQQIILKWADDPELLAKVDNGGPLTDVERTRALMIIRSVFRNWESHDHQYRNGLFDQDEWRAVNETMRYYCKRPYHREFWSEHRQEFSSSLQSTIDKIIDNEPSA